VVAGDRGALLSRAPRGDCGNYGQSGSPAEHQAMRGDPGSSRVVAGTTMRAATTPGGDFGSGDRRWDGHTDGRADRRIV